MSKFNLDTIDDLKKLKKSLETVLENRIAMAKNKKAAEDVKNGSVGELKYIFEAISDKLLNSKEGKSALKRYITTIKESKDLLNYYRMLETIKSSNGVDNPELLISESSKVCKKVTEDSRVTLGDVLNECIRCAGILDNELYSIVDDYEKSVDAPLSYVLSENASTKNIVKYSNALNEAVKRLGDRSEKKENETRSKEELIDSLNNEINEATEVYEKNALEDISLSAMNGTSNKDLFESYKNDCVSLINEAIEDNDIENKSRFLSMKEGVERKEYNESTFINDIIKLSELKETLKETI